jgi:RimJ/RimL family protein N-acetyltransferase
VAFKPKLRELIGFRRLTETDLSLMECWLAADHIVPWWGPAPTSLQVAAHYLPYIRHEHPTDSYLIMVDGTPVGYIQTFRIADWPTYWPPGKPYASEPEAAGMDLLIGDDKLTGRGLGTQVIQEFVREIVFTWSDVPACYADPAADNLASLGAFRKAGFADIGPIDAPGDPTPRRLLRLVREARNPSLSE